MTQPANLDPRHLESRDQLLRDYAEFSQRPLEEVIQNTAGGKIVASREWEAIEGDFETKAAVFYPSTKNYIFDLLCNPKNWSDELFIEKTGELHTYLDFGETFLDFGGGIGSACMFACNRGKKAFYYDICREHVEFARFRFKKYGYDVTILEALGWEHFEKFDMLYSDAVIEHFLRPEWDVNHMCDLVRPGGRLALLIDLRGTLQGQYPMHVDIDSNELMRLTMLRGFELKFATPLKNYLVFDKKISNDKVFIGVVNQFEAAQARAGELGKSVAAHAARIQELDAALKQKNSRIQELEGATRVLTDKLVASEGDRNRLNQDLATVSGIMDAVKQEVQEIRETKKAFAGEISGLVATIKSAESERNRLAELCQQIQARNTELETASSQRINDLAKVRDEHEALQKKHQQLLDSMTLAFNENLALQGKIDLLEKKLADMAAANERLEKKLADMAAVNERLEGETRGKLQEATAANASMRQELAGVRALLQESAQQSANAQNAFQQELSQRNQIVWNQKRQLMDLEFELNRIKNRPAYRVIDRVSKNRLLTKIWIKSFNLACRLAGKKPVTAPAAPQPSALPGRPSMPAPPKPQPAAAEAKPSLQDKIKGQLTGMLHEHSASAESPGVGRRFDLRRKADPNPPAGITLIVYTRGQCEPLRRLLISLRRYTDLERNALYLIDDSQDSEVAAKIDDWTRDYAPFNIVRPETRQGFFASVRSIVQRLTRSDFCIMWDTVVLTPEWLEGLKAAAYSSESIGLASPLTTFHPLYDFKMNPGDNVMTCARKLRLAATPQYPGIALPDVNIFYMKEQAAKLVPFPADSDDSTDKPFYHLVLELFKKDILPVLADDTFVYVSNRFGRMRAPGHAEIADRLSAQDKALLTQMIACTTQSPIASAISYKQSIIKLIDEQTVAIFYSTIVLGGGVIILAELNNDLILSGVDAKAVVLHPNWNNTPERFDLLFEPLWTKDPDVILSHLPDHSSIMATMWITAKLVERIARLNPTLHAYYFMQDFEVLFYDPQNPKETEYHQGASESYRLELEQLTTSEWIKEQVRGFLGRQDHPIGKLGIGINQEVYYPDVHARRSDTKIRVMAFARPSTPRRGFGDLVKAFARVHEENPDIEFALFGTADLSAYTIDFPYTNLGVLNPERLRAEYSQSHIFIDASLFQGFGLPALEAMACGCACVLTDSGGASEYAVDGQNSLLVAPGDIEAMARAILRVAGDAGLRGELMKDAVETARRFSIHNTARDMIALMEPRRAERAERVRELCQDETVNIIVPIYNEIHIVRHCLDSLARHTIYPHRIYLIDDCSDEHNAARLEEYANEHAGFIYVRNKQNLGFVGSVNRGLSEIGPGDIVLLNSDTIVTPGWLGKLVRCARSDERIGLVSPLSTRSTHMWIMPNPGDTIFDTARAVGEISEREYPDIVTPEGWCFYMTRRLFEHIGGLDPIYGRGYCEESDLSMRAFCNGYRMVCCDDLFIFHEGMVTFKSESRARYKSNREIFDHRWKAVYERIYKEFLARDPLAILRKRYAARVPREFLSAADAESTQAPDLAPAGLDQLDAVEVLDAAAFKDAVLKMTADAEGEDPRVTFLIHRLTAHDRVISIGQIVNDLIMAGIQTRVIVLDASIRQEVQCLICRPIHFASREDLFRGLPPTDLLVATDGSSLLLAVQLFQAHNNFVPVYYAQDRVLFRDVTIRRRVGTAAANRLSRLIPFCMARGEAAYKTLAASCERIRLLPPAIDQDLFYPRAAGRVDGDKKIVLTMMRPAEPHGGFKMLIEVFQRLGASRPDVELHAFGATDAELEPLGIPFEFVNHGVVPNGRLPQLYTKADVFIDFTESHEFGRAVAEAMACRTAVIAVGAGGVTEYAVDGENCLLIPAGDADAAVNGIRRLLDEPETRERLAEAGRETTAAFSRARVSELFAEGLAAARKGSEKDAARPESGGAEAEVSIVLPIANDISRLRMCLEAIARNTDVPHRVYLVDNHSDRFIAAQLEEIAQERSNFVYLRGETCRELVPDINDALSRVGPGDIVLLGAETVVTPGWLKRLARCAASDSAIGLASPLTTHCDHLWIRLNPGDSYLDAAEWIAELSDRAYPDVITPEHWCLYIRRDIYEGLGGLDPAYGDSVDLAVKDYAMRALGAGRRAVCCDDAFVFNRVLARPDELGEQPDDEKRPLFTERWGEAYEQARGRYLAANPLDRLRRAYADRTQAGFLPFESARHTNFDNAVAIVDDPIMPEELAEYSRMLESRLREAKPLGRKPRIVFLLHGMGQFGGVLSVVQLVNRMILNGFDVKVVVMNQFEYARQIPIMTKPIMFESHKAMVEFFPEADIVVGTLWITMYYIARIFVRRPNFVPAYFAQDFEVLFYPESDVKMREAVKRTYGMTPYCFAKTAWICDRVREVGGNIRQVSPALELDVFHPCAARRTGDKRTILTMMRPSTPQRGFETVVAVFKELLAERADVELHVFGASDEELAGQSIPFPFVNHGVVPNRELPALYAQAEIFAEFSNFHGFGRTIAEAMACQTACVITNSGGISQFARHGQNCLIAPPGDVKGLLAHLCRLLDEPDLAAKLAAQARKSVDRFELERSLAEMADYLFECAHYQKPGGTAVPHAGLPAKKQKPARVPADLA